MRQPATKSKAAPTHAAPPATARPRVPVWLLALLLGLVTLVLYWPAMRCGFINLDDPMYVTANPHVQGGLSWADIEWAFYNTQQAAYWVPVLWLTHMLACQLFGLNPWGHHLINVLLHVANTVLVFLVFWRMTKATWRSVMLAALFGWHPLRVESVAWIAELKDVLSTFFGLLTLWAYVKYVEAGKGAKGKAGGWYGAGLVLFALGLMSKPMLVTVPCVLLLLDYWPLGRFQPGCVWRLVREKIPFFILTAAISVVTFVLQKQGGAVVSLEALPLGERIENALVSYCRYLGKTIWPTDLAIFYPYPGYWPIAEVLLAGGFLIGVSVLVYVQRRRYPYLLVGWLWFVGTLVPVIGITQSGQQAMADRFTYLPSLGLLVLMIWGVYELTRRWRYHRVALSVAGSAAVIVCLALTHQQLKYWRNDETVFRHALAVTENSYFGRNNLGDLTLAKAHINLGAALDKKGRTAEAIRQFQDAIRLRPDNAVAHINLGIDLERDGQIAAAISQYQEVIRLKPDNVDAHINLGAVFDKQGQVAEAVSQFQEVIRLKPDYAEAHNNLGAALGKEGRIAEAIHQFQEAIRLKPDYAEAYNNLGAVLGREGRIAEAINQFREAVRLKPDYPEARNNLDIALSMEDRIHRGNQTIPQSHPPEAR